MSEELSIHPGSGATRELDSFKAHHLYYFGKMLPSIGRDQLGSPDQLELPDHWEVLFQI